MNDLTSAGRSLARVNLWRIFAISAIVTMVGEPGANAAPATWPRLGLIALSCLLVYRGYRWALWLLGVLTVLAGVLMVILAVSMTDLHWTDRILFGVPGALQVLAFVILVRAPEVRAFMEAQRNRPSRSSPTDS